MSTSLPTYPRREIPLLSRRHRLRAIIITGLRREFKRPATIVATAVGVGLVLVSSIVIVLFLGAFLPGQARDLSFFFVPRRTAPSCFSSRSWHRSSDPHSSRTISTPWPSRSI